VKFEICGAFGANNAKSGTGVIEAGNALNGTVKHCTIHRPGAGAVADADAFLRGIIPRCSALSQVIRWNVYVTPKGGSE